MLAVFDASNRENAALEYEKQRARLIRFFEWRNSPKPEEHTDETFNRIARKITEGEEIRTISSFVGGVARLVLLESYDEAKRDEKYLEKFNESEVRLRTEKRDEEDVRVPCFRKCLDEMPREQNEILVGYYHQFERTNINQRKELADKTGIPMNALRIRVHRAKVELENCLENCLKQ